jgi:hypothetical protein
MFVEKFIEKLNSYPKLKKVLFGFVVLKGVNFVMSLLRGLIFILRR